MSGLGTMRYYETFDKGSAGDLHYMVIVTTDRRPRFRKRGREGQGGLLAFVRVQALP